MQILAAKRNLPPSFGFSTTNPVLALRTTESGVSPNEIKLSNSDASHFGAK
jgi:hypothetical protein